MDTDRPQEEESATPDGFECLAVAVPLPVAQAFCYGATWRASCELAAILKLAIREHFAAEEPPASHSRQPE